MCIVVKIKNASTQIQVFLMGASWKTKQKIEKMCSKTAGFIKSTLFSQDGCSQCLKVLFCQNSNLDKAILMETGQKICKMCPKAAAKIIVTK